jgi:hypothetical protein
MKKTNKSKIPDAIEKTQEDSAFFWCVNTRTIQRWRSRGVVAQNAVAVAELNLNQRNLSPGLRAGLDEYRRTCEIAEAWIPQEMKRRKTESRADLPPFLAFGFYVRTFEQGTLVLVRELLFWGHHIVPGILNLTPSP